MHMKHLALILTLIFAFGAHAELDANQQQGLKDTQNLLRDKKQREDYFKNNPQAREADTKAGALGGSPANKEEMYDISAELIEVIARETNGDPVKMETIMQEAQKNPKAFYEKYMSANQKARVKALAEKVDKDSGKTNPNK